MLQKWRDIISVQSRQHTSWSYWYTIDCPYLFSVLWCPDCLWHQTFLIRDKDSALQLLCNFLTIIHSFDSLAGGTNLYQVTYYVFIYWYILVQHCNNSFPNALELLQPCTKPSICKSTGNFPFFHEQFKGTHPKWTDLKIQGRFRFPITHKSDTIISINIIGNIYLYDEVWIRHQSIGGCLYVKTALTHWGRVTHICVDNLSTIGAENGLSTGRHQAVNWTPPMQLQSKFKYIH